MSNESRTVTEAMVRVMNDLPNARVELRRPSFPLDQDRAELTIVTEAEDRVISNRSLTPSLSQMGSATALAKAIDRDRRVLLDELRGAGL